MPAVGDRIVAPLEQVFSHSLPFFPTVSPFCFLFPSRPLHGKFSK